MGAYWHLFIDGYIIESEKYFNEGVLSLFQVEDFIQYYVNEEGEEVNYCELESDEYSLRRILEFRASATSIKDRLEVMGITLPKAIEAFDLGRIDLIATRRLFQNGENAVVNSQIEILEKYEFEDYLKACARIIKFGYTDSNLPDSAGELIKYLVNDSWGFSNFSHNYDTRMLVRSLIECVPPDASIIFEISELFEEEEVEFNPKDLFDPIIEEYKDDFKVGEKILILAEGSSDIHILRDSMRVLYPHLLNYFSFMDFGGSNASGSAGSLVASVKSFVGAGIKNRIIAIFDNDTAAESAIRGLQKTQIPANIKILRYPDIELAKNYPSSGPGGVTFMNVNGLACSIEMYLGRDVLLKDGQLVLVQWKGYDQTVGKYQGEIMDKIYVQSKFHEKVEVCLKYPERINEYSWVEMDQLLKTIFNAFH